MVLGIISCNRETDDKATVNSIITQGIVGYNANSKKTYVKNVNKLGVLRKDELKSNEYLVSFSFTSNGKMPKFNSESEFREFVKDRPMDCNGIVELKMDNELIYSAQIINGEKFDEEIFSTSNLQSKKYPCTYKGIRACAVDGIHSQNWFDMTFCVLDGFGCVAHWYGSCFASNC